MKTKEIIKKEYKRSQVIAKKLLSGPSYKEDFDKYNYNKRRETLLAMGSSEEYIKNKYSIAAPYNIETLNRAFRGESVLAPEVFKVVNVVKREKDYIYVKIKIDEPRDRILYIVKKTLEMEQERLPESKKTRFRDEKLKALEVWELRRLRKPFKQIAKELNIKEPACKKMFYKAYELLYGKKYNPADYEKPEIKKEYLKKNCSTCREKPTCKDLCPDVITFVKQDTKTYQREPTSEYI